MVFQNESCTLQPPSVGTPLSLILSEFWLLSCEQELETADYASQRREAGLSFISLLRGFFLNAFSVNFFDILNPPYYNQKGTDLGRDWGSVCFRIWQATRGLSDKPQASVMLPTTFPHWADPRNFVCHSVSLWSIHSLANPFKNLYLLPALLQGQISEPNVIITPLLPCALISMAAWRCAQASVDSWRCLLPSKSTWLELVIQPEYSIRILS